ncbi:MAG: DnaJ domain-containing protein [Deltaproteobacteria bacterium]|nr:DnaJ domain-containing protein [Deltaproteobacteria bacterium]
MTGERDPSFDAYVLKIHEVLDKLDYYRLLGVGQTARIPEIKKAFYSIAAKFHPDRNRDADEVVRTAIYEIFKRLNEAYGVLCDYEKRQAYDAGVAEGKVRLEHETRRTMVPKTAEDSMKSRESRQFYRQATEALKGDNLLQAELHIKVARSREGEGNAAIESLFAKIQEAKAAAAAAKKAKRIKKKKD